MTSNRTNENILREAFEISKLLKYKFISKIDHRRQIDRHRSWTIILVLLHIVVGQEMCMKGSRIFIIVVFFIIGSLSQSTSALYTDNDTSSPQDSCYEERNGLFPCSSTVSGNLILTAFYGLLLATAAKFISDGAEMLLDFGLAPRVIGGVVLPVLGAVPDAAIILASGLGENAQVKYFRGWPPFFIRVVYPLGAFYPRFKKSHTLFSVGKDLQPLKFAKNFSAIYFQTPFESRASYFSITMALPSALFQFSILDQF